MAVERRTIWLGTGLVVALAALLFARSMDNSPLPVPGRRTTPPARSTARGAAHDGAAESAPAVNLEQLSKTRGEPADSERNPFRFRPKPAPPPAAAAAAARGPAPVLAPPVPVVPSGPPPPPPIALKFIGIVQKADGTRIAVLTDGKRPYYGTDGQDIEGQYRILKIGQESVEIAYIDGRGRQTLRLSGQ
jgi:hypothetical protein